MTSFLNIENRQQLKTVIAGLLAMGMLGFVYTWSMFLQPIELEMGWTRSDVVFIFNLIMMCFPIGIILAGMLNKFLPIKTTYLLASFCFSLGFLVLSFSSNLFVMYLFGGVLSGIFFGVIYNIVLYVSNLHFPHNTGVISGLMQSGLGISSLFWAKFCEYTLFLFSWRLGLMYICGLIFLVLFLTYWQIKIPESKNVSVNNNSASEQSEKDVHWKNMIKDRDFWLFWLMRLIIVAGGVGIFGNAVPIVMEGGGTISNAVFALGLMSVTNAMGRLLFGIVWDKFGSKKTMLLNCFVFTLSFLLLLFGQKSVFMLIFAFILCGLSYGAIAVIGVSFSKCYYGVRYFQQNYGWTTTATIISGFIGPLIMAIYKTNYGMYVGSYYIFLVGALIASVCTLLLRNKKA